jgi:hypothetical protein
MRHASRRNGAIAEKDSVFQNYRAKNHAKMARYRILENPGGWGRVGPRQPLEILK